MDPQQRDQAIHQGQSGPMPFPQEAQSNLLNFLKGQPIILGVSQIMIGLINIYLWIMVKVFLSFYEQYLVPGNTVYDFIFLWGPIFLIVSGTVSIVSGKKTTKQMICGSVGVNTVAAVSTGLSLIVLTLRITLTYFFFLNISAHYFITGILFMKLALIILGFIISLLLSAFGCSAVCCDMTSVVVDLSSNERGLPIAALYPDYDEVAF
ncbi:membrane-spanning 4-domains subfamily A member 4A-like [Mustela lutreola]|uniref:membrane-spanning 4-domains subfamily A member 4A-like n=1 Tax=Mustela lutreola TaxID=9666 RepID=UPI0027974557|nr:membrane-spanning 4-domains subfamily A member 4A-like [Mustela lutreola]